MPEPVPASPRRLVLHVGLHKTGTTYLQATWAANRAALQAHGVCYPGAVGEPRQHHAVRDLLGQRPRGVADDRRLTGQWQALTQLVAASPLPTALVSSEGLAVATPRQVKAAVAGFPDREVHVLVTVRDLGRVLVSAWQEGVKNDRTWTWKEFVDGVRGEHSRTRNPGRSFWLAQDLPQVISRWESSVPAPRIHLVTVPAPGAPPEELLRRVSEVVGVDPGVFTEPVARDNSSLGVAGLEVVRRLDVDLGHQLNRRQHDHVVKTVLVRALVRWGEDSRFGLPHEELDWVAEESRRQVELVRQGGYPVVGSLRDLEAVAGSGRRPDEVTVDELLAASSAALTALSRAQARLWWRRRRDDAPAVEPQGFGVRLGSARRSLGFRARRSAAALADRNSYVARVAGAYLRRSGASGDGPEKR